MRSDLRSYFANLFAGDLAAFGAPPTDEALAGHIRAEQVSLVLGYSFGIMLANACNALVLAVALWLSPDWIFALIWAAAVSSAALFFGLQARAARRVAKPQFVSRRTMYRLVRNALALGAAWGVVPVAFFANASSGGQLVITCLCAGMLAGGAFAIGTGSLVITGILPNLAAAFGVSVDTAGLLISILSLIHI